MYKYFFLLGNKYEIDEITYTWKVHIEVSIEKNALNSNTASNRVYFAGLPIHSHHNCLIYNCVKELDKHFNGN